MSRGAVPDTGVPPPAGDSLGPVNAVGATRFLAFGDSITEGVLSSFDGGLLFQAAAGADYPSQLDNLLETTFTSQDFTVDNYGVGGDEIGNALANGRLNSALATRRPQGLLLLMGINDLNSGKSVTTVVGYLQQAIDLARVYNATVLIGTMFQTCVTTDPNSGRVRTNSYDRIVSFDNALKAMATGRQNVYVADIYAAFGNNCGTDRGINLLGGDGLHPSVSGYSVMASVFAQAIRDRFAVRG
jgi:lysophospholipase L1-like esterase